MSILLHSLMMLLLTTLLSSCENANLINSSASSTSATPTATPTAIPHFVDLDTGYTHGCGIDAAGAMFCWGYDSDGQMGVGGGAFTESVIPAAVDTTNLNATETFIELSLGYYNSCAITNENRTFCWGSDSHSQLGDGGADTYKEIPTLVDETNLNALEYFTDLSVGRRFVCGITNQNNTYCWGSDTYGEIGNGAVAGNKSIPYAIDTTNMAGGEYFTQLSSGYYHNCGVTSLGNIFCWGRDIDGALGNGATVANQPSPIAITTTNLAMGETFTLVSSGYFFNCAITNQQNVYCWGTDYDGELGNGGANTNVNLPVIVDDSNLAGGDYFTKLDSAWSHTCGISNLGKTYCWGADGSGQIGDGAPLSDKSIPTLINEAVLQASEQFTLISTAGYFSCAISDLDNSYCWGSDGNEELGDGAGYVDQSSPLLVDISNL